MSAPAMPTTGQRIRKRIYLAARVAPNLVLPNGEFEGFARVGTEASACGGVPLASAYGGLREAAIDGITGFLLSPGQPESWVDQIVEINQWSAERRADFVERSVAETAARYQSKHAALETFQAYEKQ